jgi:hypothetical protein
MPHGHIGSVRTNAGVMRGFPLPENFPCAFGVSKFWQCRIMHVILYPWDGMATDIRAAYAALG